jgi:Kef-type K+ transport system membrane component KefB
MPSFSLDLPLQDPVTVFALLLLLFLLIPILLKQIRLPGIMGLILAGVVIGPNGLYLLERNTSIILFGTVGLLYIAFVAGLEVDLNDFKRNRNKSILFGCLSFFIPFLLGIFIVRKYLGYEWNSSILLASTFGSHTLLSYPIVSRLGITKNESVNITVGGSIITDFLALLVLAIIARSSQGELNTVFWTKLSISLLIFIFLVLVLLPKVAAWFFKNLEAEGSSQFTFVLSMVFVSAFLAKQTGLEPILGSFLAGLALNKFILHTSALMNRIEFIGKALFIPFFLVGVGMLVDPKVIFQGWGTLQVAGVMIGCVLSGKWMAGAIAAKLFGYNKYERRIIFSLSVAQAAATLAAILVGYNLGLLNKDVLNATILMILTTCIISSLIAESAGKKLAILERDSDRQDLERTQRILVPIANPDSIERLIDLSLILQSKRADVPIYPLVVVRDEDGADEKIKKNHELLESAVKHASASENSVQIVTRIDWNIGHGIVKAAKEHMITHILMGWNGKITTKDRIFGTVLDNVLESTDQIILVSKIQSPLNTLKNVILVIPENSEIESDFYRVMENIETICTVVGAKLDIFCDLHSKETILSYFPERTGRIPVKYSDFSNWDFLPSLKNQLGQDSLLVIISARNGAISHRVELDSIPYTLSHDFKENNFLIIYPAR